MAGERPRRAKRELRPGNPTAAATLPSLNARDSLSRTTQALQAVRAMQDAARAAASGGPANLGPNPFQPGQSLPNVPNGLASGGLKVAPGVPADLAASGHGRKSGALDRREVADADELRTGRRTSTSCRRASKRC